MKFQKSIMILFLCLILVFSVIADDAGSDPDGSIEEPAVTVTEEVTGASAGEVTDPPLEEVVDPSIEEVIDTPEEETPVEDPTDELPPEETIVEEPLLEEPSPEELINDTQEVVVEENQTPEETIPEIDETEEVVEESSEEEVSLLSTLLDLVLDKFSYIKGEIVDLKAQLSYDNSSPLPNQPVDFFVDEEKIGTETTDDSGFAQIDWDTSDVEPGVYIVGVDFPGDEVFDISSDSAEITIEEIVEEDDNATEEPALDNLTEEIIEENETIEMLTTIEDNITNTTEKTTETTDDGLPEGVERIEECKEEEYTAREPMINNCSNTELECEDEPLNKSCVKNEVVYPCFAGWQTVQKTKKVCTTKGYVIKDKIQLDTDKYECSITEDSDDVIVTCDSRYDGNGDGKCTSGESCMKFVIDGEEVSRSEKNSRDNFIEEDESFFLERASVEVLK